MAVVGLGTDHGEDDSLDAADDASVATRLERLIRAGEWRVGERLPPERALMARFGVSRAVVREAISLLAGKRLLRTRPRCRPVVQKPDDERALSAIGSLIGQLMSEPNGIKNLFDSRVFIESALVRHVASHGRRDTIEELSEALARNRAAIADSDAFYRTDVAFHGVLYRAPGNPVYPALHKVYVRWLSSHWKDMDRGPEINRMNYAGHKALHDSILARDPDAAEQALQRHLQVAWEYLSSTFAGLDDEL